jgi:hypothetical protein
MGTGPACVGRPIVANVVGTLAEANMEPQPGHRR